MPRQIKREDECLQAILRGMDAVADLVGSTLGPRGHTVIIGRPMGPALITKDGVTVAEGVSVQDPWENEGAKLIQQAARRTNTEAGDGTTAATILTRALFREGIRQIAAGGDSQSIERGMRRAAAAVVGRLRELAIPVKQEDLDRLRAVATVAANGDTEMGAVIAQAVSHAGLEGNYTLDPSPTLETTWEAAAGLQFQRGLDRWPQFMNDARGMAIFAPANILVTDRHLIDGKETAQMLQVYRAALGAVPLLIIAEDVAQGALQVLTVNNKPDGVRVCPVRAPASGQEKKEFLEDIAILTGARMFSIARGDKLESAKPSDFGSADRVLVTPHRTTIIGGAGTPERVEMRKDELRARIAERDTPEFERAGLERRLAQISAKIAIIKIGAGLNSKLLEKRDRAEDSLNATLGALKEGIVPGGGVALLRARNAIAARPLAGAANRDEEVGWRIVLAALTAPIRGIAHNCGASPDVVVDQVSKLVRLRRGAALTPNIGFNGANGSYEDLVAAGVIDPVKVVRLALENAVELAGLLLTSAGGVVEVPDPHAARPDPRQIHPGPRP